MEGLRLPLINLGEIKYVMLVRPYIKRFLYTFILITVMFSLTACKNVNTTSNGASNDAFTFVHFIDVGQADSILIESRGQILLMDAGNHDDGKKVINYIKERGIERIDYVIASHPHEDHIGGLDDVIDKFDVGKIFFTDYVLPSTSFENLLATIKKKKLQIVIPSVGDEYALGNASFMFVAPVKKDYGSKVNNYSLGIKLTDRENTFLLTSDAEEVAEMDMAESGMDITADVLKVNHHGSITSSTEVFIEAVKPSYAVISVGKDNPYGNPSRSVLTRLLDHNVKIYRTDLMGTITAISDGKNITFKTEKSINNARIMEAESIKITK